MELELTESAILHDNNHTKEAFKQLSNIGIPQAIDGDVTDYSSMGYLHNLPLKEIKTDRTFMHQIECNKTGQAIVSLNQVDGYTFVEYLTRPIGISALYSSPQVPVTANS
ncbi:MAG: hypothetical protein B6D70_10480, partial [gamma proteobacterium symbiont of Stewartia floridana]